jgi:hypothetical protein
MRGTSAPTTSGYHVRILTWTNPTSVLKGAELLYRYWWVTQAPKGSTGPIVAPPLQLLVSLPKILKFFKKIVKDSLGTY